MSTKWGNLFIVLAINSGCAICFRGASSGDADQQGGSQAANGFVSEFVSSGDYRSEMIASLLIKLTIQRRSCNELVIMWT